MIATTTLQSDLVESAEFRRGGGHFPFGPSAAEISHTDSGPITVPGSAYTNRTADFNAATIAMSLSAGPLDLQLKNHISAVSAYLSARVDPIRAAMSSICRLYSGIPALAAGVPWIRLFQQDKWNG